MLDIAPAFLLLFRGAFGTGGILLPLNELAVPNRVTGERQVRRTLAGGRLRKLFIAEDADPSVIKNLEEEARRQNIPVERVDSMLRLGRACAITRGASAAGIEG